MVDDEIAGVLAITGVMRSGNRNSRGRYLGWQLVLTEGAMGRGITRGWRPSYDRDEQRRNVSAEVETKNESHA